MTVGLYMDVHINRAVTLGLRRRGVDVLTAQDDAAQQLDDAEWLDRAGTLNRVVFTHDDDFLAECSRRQQAGEHFAGLVYVDQRRLPVSKMMGDLELIARVYDPVDIADRVEFCRCDRQNHA
jgi:predicted nuclease of predicted toxin-antitoxin system